MTTREAAGTDDPASDDPAGHRTTAPVRRIGALRWLGVGAASSILGLLPWVITGSRLPLQNLWAEQTPPEQMPIALLPFSQYTITLVLGLIIVGSAVAGLAARALCASRRHLASAAVGLFGIQIAAAVQAALVTGQGLRQARESMIYLVAVCAVAVVAIVVGAVVFFAIARMPRPAAALAMGVAAVASAWWFGGLLIPLGSIPGELQLLVANQVQRWLPAVLIGVAIAWCGVRSTGRVIVAIAMLGILALVPPLATAITSAVGSRVLARYPGEMLDYGLQVFRSALAMPELTLWPVVLAILVAVVGTVIVRRRRPVRD